MKLQTISDIIQNGMVLRRYLGNRVGNAVALKTAIEEINERPEDIRELLRALDKLCVSTADLAREDLQLQVVGQE